MAGKKNDGATVRKTDRYKSLDLPEDWKNYSWTKDKTTGKMVKESKTKAEPEKKKKKKSKQPVAKFLQEKIWGPIK